MSYFVELTGVKNKTSKKVLLNTNHHQIRSKENDVPDIPGIDPGGELLGGGQDCGDGFFIVPEVAQKLIADRSVVCRDPDAVAWIAA